MLSQYGIEQQRARKGLVRPQAWSAGDGGALPEQGMRASRSDTRAASQVFERMHAVLIAVVPVYAVRTCLMLSRVAEAVDSRFLS